MPAFPSLLTGPPPPPISVGLSDLTIASLLSSPTTPNAGDSVWLTAVVQNNGDTATPAGTPIEVDFSIVGAVGTYRASVAGPLAPNSTVLISYVQATGMNVDGGSGTYASTPDTATNSVTGDIDMRAQIAPVTWHPTALSIIIGKEADATHRSYAFGVNSTGSLFLGWSADGSTNLTTSSNATVGYADDGTKHWVRVTMDVNDGGGNRVINFYTSEDYDPTNLASGTWTPVGTTITTGGTTSIFNGTQPVEVGALFIGTVNRFDGNIYRAQVLNGIGGTLAAEFDPTDAVQGQTSWTGTAFSETWTMHGNALLLGLFTADDIEFIANATVDPRHLIPETSEINNTKTLAIEPFLTFPDLTVNSISMSPAVPVIGDSVVFSASVTNNGLNATPAGTLIGLSWAVDGTIVQYERSDFSSMLPGETRTFTADTNATTTITDLVLSGAATPVITTPDSASLDITGDIDIRAKVALTDWTPSVATYFVSKWRTSGNQRAYAFSIDTTGHLKLEWSTNGTAVTTATASAATSITDGTTSWVRAVLKVANPYRAKFYKSTDGTTWTQIGTNVDGGAGTSIFASTAPLDVGALDGSGTLTGKVFRVQVLNGLGGPNTITRVQAATNTTGANAASFSPGSLGALTPGNTLVVYLATRAAGFTAPGAGWTRWAQDNVNASTEIWTREIVSGDATPFNFTCTSSQCCGRIEEWSGVREVVDTSGVGHTTGAATSVVTASLGSTTYSVDLVAAAVASGGGGTLGSPTFTDGITNDTTDLLSGTATKCDLTTGTLLLSSPTSIGTVTCNYSNSTTAGIAVVAFKGYTSTVVADLDFTRLDPTTPFPFTDGQGNVWSAVGTPVFDLGTTPSWIATAGSHSVLATVDDQGLIPQSDHTNDQLASPFTVAGVAGFADLIVTGVSMSPVNPVSGDAVTLTATIKNQGDTATPGGIIPGVGFYLDGGGTVASSTGNTNSLAAGATRNQSADGGSTAALDVLFPGDSASYLDSPDSAAFDITGDIDIQAKVALTDWTPTADQVIASKWNITGNQRSWALAVQATTGKLVLSWSTDGTAVTSATSTVATGFADTVAGWVRVWLSTLNPYQVRFYTSTDGVTWTPLGSVVNGGAATSIFNSTAAVTLGGIAGTGSLNAKLYRFKLYNGINGPLPTRVQSKTAVSTVNGTTVNITLDTTPTVGNFMLVYVTGGNVWNTPTNWTRVVGDDVQADLTLLCHEVLAGDTATYTFTNTASVPWAIRIEEWSGVRNVVDKTASNHLTAVTTIPVSPGTTSVANELVAAALSAAIANPGDPTLTSPSFNQSITNDSVNLITSAGTANKFSLTTGTRITTATNNFTTTSGSWTGADNVTMVFASFRGYNSTLIADIDATVLNTGTPFPYTDPEANVWTKHGTVALDTAGGGGTWIATTGHHTIVAWVDDAGRLTESDENNNTYSFPFDVTTASRNATEQPFASTSPFNVSLGDGITTPGGSLGSAGHIDALSFGVGVANAGYDYVAPTDSQVVVSFIRSSDGLTADEYLKFNLAGQTVNVTSLTGSGINTPVAIRPSKISPLAGIIRNNELTNGVIPHALALAVDATIMGTTFVWPAAGQEADAGTNTGSVPEGSLLAIPWATGMPGGMSTAGQIIFTALQTYGGYVVQRSGSGIDILAETQADAAVNPARADLPAILPLLRVVTNNSTDAGVTNVGGPGVRRGPVAPAAIVAGPTGGQVPGIGGNPNPGGGVMPGTRQARTWPGGPNNPYNVPINNATPIQTAHVLGSGASGEPLRTSHYGTTFNNAGYTPGLQTDPENHNVFITTNASGQPVTAFDQYGRADGTGDKFYPHLPTGQPDYSIKADNTQNIGEGACKYESMLGVIRAADFNTYGGIFHALNLWLLNTDLLHYTGAGNINGAVWPAFGVDGDWNGGGSKQYTGTVPIGSRLFIPRSLAKPSGMSALGSMMWDAARDYGCYVTNRSGNRTFQSEAAGSAWEAICQATRNAGDCQKIMAALAFAPIGTFTSASRGGPGTTTIPSAPVFQAGF